MSKAKPKENRDAIEQVYLYPEDRDNLASVAEQLATEGIAVYRMWKGERRINTSQVLRVLLARAAKDK